MREEGAVLCPCAGSVAHPFKNDAEKPRSDGLGRPVLAPSLAHLFATSMLFSERMCQGASTAPFA